MAAPVRKFRIPTLQEIDELKTPKESYKPQVRATEKDPSEINIETRDDKTAPQSSSTHITKTKIIENKGQPFVQHTTNSGDNSNETTPASGDKQLDANQTVPCAAAKSSNSLLVNPRQRGNPILKNVRNITWEYSSIIPDYVMGQSNCAIFLSLRYHQLHPNYIHDRLKQLGRSYDLRVMLVQVDVKDPQHLLKDIAKICILAECTLILAFSAEEAGRYLETYKIFENKPPEAIMEKTDDDFMSKMTDCMTKVKSVNKTDCATLISQFGSVANIIESSEEDLSLCPGFGPQKAKRLHSLFREPFRRQVPKVASGKTK